LYKQRVINATEGNFHLPVCFSDLKSATLF